MARLHLLAAGALLLGSVPAAIAASPHAAPDSGGPTFVPMDEMRVPIVDGARADGTLRMKLVLVARDPAGAEQLTAAMPVLRAVSLGAGIEFARLYASSMTPVDAARLASVMTAALRSRTPAIARVLLVEVAAARAA